MTSQNKVMISEDVANVLVRMWFEKGQLCEDLCEPLRDKIANREHDPERIERWATEVQAWRTKRSA